VIAKKLNAIDAPSGTEHSRDFDRVFPRLPWELDEMTIEQDRDQLLLELVNRARLDPGGEAERYGLADLSSGTGVIITQVAKQVLAPNEILAASATGHNEYMAASNAFSHTGAGGSQPHDRMVAAGFGVAGTFGSGENIAWGGTTGTLDVNAQVYQLHENLFLSAGHRRNILNANYEQLGTDTLYDSSYQGYKALLVTENFAYKTTTENFITGVSYNDTDNNDFYSIGESKAGRSVVLKNGDTVVASGVTTASGGYGIGTTYKGGVEVVWSGGDLTSEQGVQVVLGDRNIKVDLTDGDTIETNVSATLTRASENLTLIGIDNVNATGTSSDNDIKGNKGNNTLNGAGGNDRLEGGAGADRLIGGAGSDTLKGGDGEDTAVFEGARSAYEIGYLASTQMFTIRGADGSVDTVTGVESFEFAGQTYTAADVQSGAIVPVTVSTSAVAATVTEGNAGATALSFKITLSAAGAGASVNYVLSGRGANGEDISGALSGTVTFAAGEVEKTITVSVNGDLTFEENELLTLSLSTPSSPLTISTASASTTIVNDDVKPVMFFGQSSADQLKGTKGVDEIRGFDGDDRLDGSKGADRMYGGAGHDTYVVDNNADIVSEADGSGIDTVLSSVNFSLSSNSNVVGDIENLTLTGKAMSGTGSNAENILIGNKSANILVGLDGNDRLDGGKSGDTLRGGAGDDTYVVDSAKDVIDEVSNNGNGIDTVLASTSFDIRQRTGLSGDVENLTLVGKNAIYGSGSSGDNIVHGSIANNTLFGNEGNDTIDGHLGNDNLYGGAGGDTFKFSDATFGKDVVKDFQDGIDHLAFALSVADSFSDFVITGNDTAAVTITIGANSVVLYGTQPIHITADDFVFV
jgi:Ca2+-binding RTX toxin-like protein